MKKLILCGLICLFCSSIFGQTKEFYEKAIGTIQCRDCYFISLDIESKSYSGKIVVDNYALFSYLESVKGLDKQAYKSFMVNLFQDNQPLPMENVNIDETGSFLVGKKFEPYTFRIVETSQTFDAISAQGCTEILKHYFSPEIVEHKTDKTSDCKKLIKLNKKDLFLRPKFDLIEQNNIISKLFEMEIPISLDDISGSLMIAYHRLK